MTVKAIFKCKIASFNFAGTFSGNPHKELELTFEPVINDTEENKTWSNYTPSGLLKMRVTNPDCYDKFEVGEDYILTFEKRITT